MHKSIPGRLGVRCRGTITKDMCGITWSPIPWRN